MKKHKIYRVIRAIAVGLVCGIAIGLLVGCTPQNVSVPIPQPGYETEQRAERIQSITVSGVVESVTSRNVYTTLGFTVDSVDVSVGDRVTQGQTLGMLDTRDLELVIAQQQAVLETARRNSQIALTDSTRMLNEATANVANNTNPSIIAAEAALTAATQNLADAQRSYDNARLDYNVQSNINVQNTESALNAARVELEARTRELENAVLLEDAGALSQHDLNLAEDALAHATNQYNTAMQNFENATTGQQRSLDQLEDLLQLAVASQAQAQRQLSAARTGANQDIERLRSNVASAEASANVEAMEITLQQLERQLEDSTLTAPISGTVTAVIAREGAVGMGLMFTVEDTDNLRIITSFREYDLARVHVGMPVTITSDSTGSAVHTGEITGINPAATPNSPIVEFEAEIAVTSGNLDLRIGVNTRINIALD